MSLKRSRLKSDLPSTATLSPLHRPGGEDAAGDGYTGRATYVADAGRAGGLSGDARRGSSVDRTRTSKRRLQRRVTPLAVLQVPLEAGMRKVFDLRRFLIVLALTAIVLFLPRPAGLSVTGHHAFALVVFTGAILALEPAPLPIAALMVPIAQIALGINSASAAFVPFSRTVVFLILGSLFLAEALRKHGLTRRLALHAIQLSGGKLRWLLLALMVMTAAISMWVLNTATTAVLIPVAISIAQQVRRQEYANRVLKLLILAIAYSASIGAMATPLGGAEIAIAVGLLSNVKPFGFLDWMRYGLPVVIIMLPLAWWLLQKAMPLPDIVIDTKPVTNELRRLGGLSSPEREVLVVLFLSIFLWVGGPALETALGLPPTLLNSAVVAIGAVVLLSIEEVVDWNDLKGVNWGIFFIIGAGLSLGDALDKSGASAWLAHIVAPFLQGLPYILILAVLIPVIYMLTQFTNSVTWAAILAPMLITLGQASDIDPVRLVVPMTLTLAFCFLLPISSARMTLVYVTGSVTRKEMLVTGLTVGLPGAIFVLLYFIVISRLGLI